MREPAPPTLLDAVRVRVRRLSVLGGGPDVTRKAAARALAELSQERAVELLSQVLRLAQERWPPAMHVLPAFLRALEEEASGIPHVASLRQVAALHGADEVELLFSEGQAVASYHQDAAARADAKLFTAPLGHLKTRARLTRNPDELARLAAVSNPAVTREVLRNARTTEAIVVGIAARRPARPEPLFEIWRTPKWIARAAVRRALAFNPYVPPEIGVKVVALLVRVDLEAVARDASLHASLRQEALRLLHPWEGGPEASD